MGTAFNLFAIATFSIFSVSADFVGNREVYFHKEPRNFFSAFEICRLYGQQLLTSQSAKENGEIRAVMEANKVDLTWLGATDLGTSRQWVWIMSGRPVTSLFWVPGEPNNSNERCVEITIYGALPNNWNDKECYNANPFFCEDVPGSRDETVFADPDPDILITETVDNLTTIV